MGKRVVNGKAIKQPINLVKLSLRVRQLPELRFSLFMAISFRADVFIILIFPLDRRAGTIDSHLNPEG
ncbi:MAG: hypothetical protein SWQ30_19165 [Thermodesulfobacteriota bacterium]|nr:hypothetical protein [Thermodesulfobacteriota bacterium]